MAQAWQVRGIVLPDGEYREFWVADGRIVAGPVAGAQLLGGRESVVLPGLVDAHCHIGLSAVGAVDAAEQEVQAVTERQAGVLLARDCGAPADTRWIDTREDLPRIVRAGQHIARTRRYLRNVAVEIEPDQLVETVDAQARLGDGWVKLIGDWIDRGTGDLGPCWPPEALRAAVQRAHERGARITTHVFGEDALPDVIAAGFDCIEHGTGLPDAALQQMASAGIALVPTLINIATFPDIAAAAESKFPRYARHMLALHQRAAPMVRTAVEAGVQVYAGTDAGGTLAHGRIADEVLALHAAGMPAAAAVAAACWAARSWLGAPATLTEGVAADFVVLPGDPRHDPRVLRRPTAVVLRGRRYRSG